MNQTKELLEVLRSIADKCILRDFRCKNVLICIIMYSEMITDIHFGGYISSNDIDEYNWQTATILK